MLQRRHDVALPALPLVVAMAVLRAVATAVAVSRPHILIFGDSLAAGYTSFTSGPGPGLVPSLQRALSRAHGLDVEVTAMGVAGRTTGEALKPLRRQLRARRYDAIAILLGSNDLYPYLPGQLPGAVLNSMVANLAALHAAVRESGTRSIALGIPDHPAFVSTDVGAAALAKVNGRIQSDVGAHAYIEMRTLLSAAQDAWSWDHIHPQHAGYKLLGEHLAGAFAALWECEGVLNKHTHRACGT
jgi:lysophospholipase L1-like esterase